MGNCLAPFHLTGQTNLFHVMALFTCLTKPKTLFESPQVTNLYFLIVLCLAL